MVDTKHHRFKVWQLYPCVLCEFISGFLLPAEINVLSELSSIYPIYLSGFWHQLSNNHTSLVHLVCLFCLPSQNRMLLISSKCCFPSFFSVFLSLYPSLLLLLFRLPFCTYLSVNSRLSLRNSSSFCCLSSVFYFHTQSSFSFASNHFLLLFFPPFCYLQHCNLILPPFKLSACS